MDVTFEEMSLAHLDGVMEIEEVSFPSPWSRYAFAYEILQNSLAHYIVALAGNKVVGYAGMWLILDDAHITNVAVHPAWRRKGIGMALMLEMIGRAVLMGMKRMTLEVRPSNKAARVLYAALGFVERGLRKHYYSDTGEDAIIMWKDDLAGGGQGFSSAR
ncbi:MAG: ribosomal protein S18-alanine N-acetyltransferase [Peptococcaceae bacterium]|nr:ribosomal protein S18-alanine N-acetyltransferase [Peptococcaceae bacterium]